MMKLSELLREIGDEKLQFQVLNQDVTRTDIFASHARVTFNTAPESARGMEAGELRAFVVWMPESDVQAAGARLLVALEESE